MKLQEIKSIDKSLECFNLKKAEFDQAFIDPLTGKLKAGLAVERACPLCGANSGEQIFEKFGMDYRRCLCGMVYISPYIKFDDREKWYESSPACTMFWKEIVLPSRSVRIEKIWKPRIEKLESQNIDWEQVLDIGCGSGEFVHLIAQEYTKNIIGLDPNEQAVNIAQDYVGDMVKRSSFDDIEMKDEAFSLVTLWEVFHHFESPVKIMKKIYKLLRTGGKVVLQSPNFAGFDYQVLGAYHHDVTFEIPNYFDRQSIERVLEMAGFDKQQIYCETPGRLDVQYVQLAIKRYGMDIIKDPFIQSLMVMIDERNSELGLQYQDMLRERRLSGSMLIIATK